MSQHLKVQLIEANHYKKYVKIDSSFEITIIDDFIVNWYMIIRSIRSMTQ